VYWSGGSVLLQLLTTQKRFMMLAVDGAQRAACQIGMPHVVTDYL
jgi:hypothetical protein